MARLSVLLLVLHFGFASIAQTVSAISASSMCEAQRDDLRSAVNSLTPTTTSGYTCKSNYVNALNCCNGYGDGCAINTASSSGTGLAGATAGFASASMASASALTANADLCKRKFTQATCAPVDMGEANYRQTVFNKYQALQTCFSGGATKLAQMAAQSTSSTQAASADGVTNAGIKNALYQGADGANTSTTGDSQQAAWNLKQKAMTICLTACTFMPGSGDQTTATPLSPPEPAPIVRSLNGDGTP